MSSRVRPFRIGSSRRRRPAANLSKVELSLNLVPGTGLLVESRILFDELVGSVPFLKIIKVLHNSYLSCTSPGMMNCRSHR